MTTDAWLLRVLRAFRDTMNNGTVLGAPGAVIGWPTRAMNQGAYQPFVWFARDPISFDDGVEHHSATQIVTGIVFFTDQGKNSESELEQAINAYYAMRRELAADIENKDSHFNSLFEGLAMPADEDHGVQPTPGGDFDGHSVIGERWKVIGTAAAIGADDA